MITAAVIFNVFIFAVGEEIKAHSNIISGNPVMAAMLSVDMAEAQNRTIDIVDIKPEVFRQLLQFLYTGKANKEPDGMAENLLAAADKYQVELLKEECAELLAKKLNVANAVRLLVRAHLHNSTSLLSATLLFIKRNARTICSSPEWRELARNYPDLSVLATLHLIG